MTATQFLFFFKRKATEGQNHTHQCKSIQTHTQFEASTVKTAFNTYIIFVFKNMHKKIQ